MGKNGAGIVDERRKRGKWAATRWGERRGRDGRLSDRDEREMGEHGLGLGFKGFGLLGLSGSIC